MTHTYAQPGTYTVTVRTNANEVGVTTAEIWPATTSQPPIANPGGPYRVVAGASLILNGADSFDPAGRALTYTWSFGDTNGQTTNGASVTHRYEKPGSYTVTLWVNNGQQNSVPVSTTVTVSPNLIPIVNTVLE